MDNEVIKAARARVSSVLGEKLGRKATPSF
jgi:hypothetical protein